MYTKHEYYVQGARKCQSPPEVCERGKGYRQNARKSFAYLDCYDSHVPQVFHTCAHSIVFSGTLPIKMPGHIVTRLFIEYKNL